MEDGIRCTTADLASALSRGDAAAAAELYADDGRLLAAAADVLLGREQIEAYWREGIAFGLSCVELTETDLHVDDNTAVEIGRYRLEVAVAGRAAVADVGKYVALHRRQTDGSWRRAVDVFNPDAPQPARSNRKGER